jgi:protein subunit release factor B
MVGITLLQDDVIESFVRSSGPGGQNVNKVATCVVLLHKPTGTMVKCQKFRTQFQNRQLAWVMLQESLRQREEQQRLFRQQRREKIRRQNRKRSLSAKERMLEDKKKNTYKKQNRKKVVTGTNFY